MNKGGEGIKKWEKRLKIEREHENHVSVRQHCASIKNTQENITAAKKLPQCKILNTKETFAARTVHVEGDAKSYFFI